MSVSVTRVRFRHTLNTLIGLIFLGSLFHGPPVDAAVAGPGSGSATISPEIAVVATPGKWSIVYTAEEDFSNGTIRITIPPGWTAPQDTNSTSPGYVTVISDTASANPSLLVAGQVVTISVIDLPQPKTVTLVYGDDSGGASPGARAKPATTALDSVVFLVESDPTGTSLQPIASSPTVDLRAGPATNIEVSPADTTIAAGDTMRFLIEVQDASRNRTSLPEDRVFSLVSGATAVAAEVMGAPEQGPWEFFDPSDPNTPITTLTLPVGTEVAGLLYRNTDTNDGKPHLVVVMSADGLLPKLSDVAKVTVTSVIDTFVFALGQTTWTAGDTVSVEVQAFDRFDNPIDDDTTAVTLSSTTGNVQFQSSGDILSAGSFSTTARDEVVETVRLIVAGSGRTDTSAVITVNPADSVKLVKISNDATGVAVDDSVVLEVRVTDAYGNAVPGEPVVFWIDTDPRGNAFLSDDDITNVKTRITRTDTWGVAWVRLHPGSVVGKNTVISSIRDGTPPDQRKTFSVTTRAGDVDYLAVTPDVVEQLAGEPVGFTVDAFDKWDNAVNDDTTIVYFELDPGTGGSFENNNVLLQGGTVTSSITTNDAPQTIAIRASSQVDPAVTGLSWAITISPHYAFGEIVGEADDGTITGDGSSTTIVRTVDAIRDTFGNIVSQGTLIDVNITPGTIFSPDADPVRDGIQRATDAAGHISFTVRSATVGGSAITAQVEMNAVSPGTAAGTLSVVFAPEPDLTYTGPSVPRVVMPGDSVAFTVEVQNESPTAVKLLPTTTFRFSDGGELFETTLEDTTFVSANGSNTLSLKKEKIDDLMDPIQITPTLDLRGTNEFEDPFHQAFDLPPIWVAPVKIVGVLPDGSIVSTGQTRTITVNVHNDGPVPASVDSVNFDFSVGNQYFVYDPLQAPPVDIPPDETVPIEIQVTVQQTAPDGLTTIDASVVGTAEGTTVWDTSLAPLGSPPTWQITQAVNIVYEPRSLGPRVVSAGQTHSFSVVLENTGGAAVELESTTTTLSFTDGTDSYSAHLKQNEALGRGESQRVEFVEEQVPTTMQPDTQYDVRLFLNGEENGIGFEQELFTGDAGDSVTVQIPAVVDYAGGLSPEQVSQGTWRAFQIDVTNSGTASVELDSDSTWFTFGGLYRAGLDANVTKTITSGDTTLRFESAMINTPVGPYPPTVQLIGTENGIRFETILSIADQVTVQTPADIDIISLAPSQPTITVEQGKSIDVWMEVENNTAADVRFDSAQVAFVLPGEGNRTFQFDIEDPTGFENFGTTLPGNLSDILTFSISDDASTTMLSGIYVIEGRVWVTDVIGEQPDFAFTDAGQLILQDPGRLEITRIIPAKETVTKRQTEEWTVAMHVKNSGEATVSVPDSATLIFDKGTAWNPILLSSTPMELGSNDSTIIVFNIEDSGEEVGPVIIDGTVEGTELNDDSPKTDSTSGPPKAGSVTVQDSAKVEIVQVTLSDSSITENQDRDWTIAVTVKNSGEAELELSTDPNETFVEFPSADPPMAVAPPPADITLVAEDSTLLTFTVTQTPGFGGIFDSPHPIDVRVAGLETNRNILIADGSTTSVQVHLTPEPSYSAGSLEPSSVKAGNAATFSLDIYERLGASTVHLEPSQTRLVFEDNFGHRVRVQLDPDSATAIAPGDTTTLWFEQKVVSPDFVPGFYDVTLVLRGTENKNDFFKDDFPNLEPIEIRPTTRIRIQRVWASRDRVSQDQDRDWAVTMVVTNLGDGAVRVKPTTRLVLRIGGANVTGDYDIDPNLIFDGSGTDILPAGPGTTDSLVFAITSTGSQPGELVIHGVFDGEDVEQLTDVTDNTFDEGERWGKIRVEEAGRLRIVAVETSQPEVTVGQTVDWRANVRVKNEGEAAVNLTIDSTPPEIRPIPDSGFEWVRPDSFETGGVLLAGDGTGILVFTATETGNAPALTTLHAAVVGVDTNSLVETAYDTEDTGNGFGQITVEDLGRVVLKSTTVVAPNAPYVNVEQDLAVRVELANEGEADLEDVSFAISSSGASAPPQGKPDTLVADLLPGGESVVDTFWVLADDVTGPETFTVNVVTGVDANSGQLGLLAEGPHEDQMATIQKQTPSTLTIESIEPSQPAVTRLQVQDWHIDVEVKNDGGDSPPVDVVPPEPSNVTFFLGPQQVVDYVVLAPDAFLSGEPDLRLHPGESDTFRYTVASTGADAGEVTIRVEERWADANDPEERTTESSGNITVVNPSGLFIETTTVDPATAPNSPQPNLVLVNSDVPFDAVVSVQNIGEDVEDLDSVRVKLVSDNPSNPVELVSDYVEILRDQQHTFAFTVNLDPLEPDQPLRQEILTSSIIYAVSKSSGEVVTAQQPADNQEFIIVQQPANLNISATVPDTTLSTDQSFPLTVRVSNNGVAAVDETGKITVTVPDGFEVGGGSSDERGFVVEKAVEFLVRTPTEPAQAETLRAQITTRPVDKNSGGFAAVTDGVDIVVVEIVQQARLSDATVVVHSPDGAQDGILSTGQQFEVRGSVFAEEATTQITATLDVISGTGFHVIDGPQKPPVDGTGGTLSTTWTVGAPTDPGTGEFRVRYEGFDENTGVSVGDTSDALALVVVPRAELTLDAFISWPQEAADDNTVARGTTFGVDAIVTIPPGYAGVDLNSTALLRIEFDDAPEYQLDDGDDVTEFRIGESVTWTVRAPDVITPWRQISVRISAVPGDENSGSPAAVQNREELIPIQTERDFVTAYNLSEALGFDTRVVPAGTSDIRVLAIELANPSPLADRVRVDSIAVSILDRLGRVASNPSRTITQFYARFGGGPIGGQVNQNPMIIDLFEKVGGIELTPGEADSFVFSVSISNSAELDEITLSIENAEDIVIRNITSAEEPLIGVVDKTTLGSIRGKIRSQPLVILSDSPDEYAHNYPNPFRAGSQVTRIAYIMEKDGPVSVKIYDLTGELVYERRYSTGEPGTIEGPQEVTWDGRNMKGEVVRNGIYICQIDTGSQSVRITMAVAK